MKLEGKVAIVTGAGTGIGRATSKMLAAEGAKLVLVGRRIEPLEAVVEEIKQAGGEAIAHSADLVDGDAAAAVADFTLGQYGRIDILVNNAGFSSKVRSVKYVQPDEWESVFRINIDAVFRLTQACLPHMLERGQGTIITTSSMAALKPGVLGGSPYSAAKAASLNFSHGLNSELRASGIRATAIVPAEVDTPILDGRPSPPDSEARKLMMQPEDVEVCIHLAATMPERTVIEEIVVAPTVPRDMSAEMEMAKKAGAPKKWLPYSILRTSAASLANDLNVEAFQRCRQPEPCLRDFAFGTPRKFSGHLVQELFCFVGEQVDNCVGANVCVGGCEQFVVQLLQRAAVPLCEKS